MDLSDRQQTLIRVTLRSDQREWERLAKEHAPWPYAEQRAAEVKQLLDLLYQGDLSLILPEHNYNREIAARNRQDN